MSVRNSTQSLKCVFRRPETQRHCQNNPRTTNGMVFAYCDQANISLRLTLKAITMFDADAIHDRGRALEDEFFHRVDEALLANLRESMEREEAIKQLKEATGFQDDELIGHLLDAGIDVSKLAALSLVPAIFVGWADGSITTKERQAILSAALHRGINVQKSAQQLVESWLSTRPSKSLWKLWKEYAHAFVTSLPKDHANMMANEIYQQAKAVAEASRQSIEFRKISTNERAILDEIKETMAM